MDKRMIEALIEDGENLKAMTGEDHGPVFLADDECCGQHRWNPPVMCGGCPLRSREHR